VLVMSKKEEPPGEEDDADMPCLIFVGKPSDVMFYETDAVIDDCVFLLFEQQDGRADVEEGEVPQQKLDRQPARVGSKTNTRARGASFFGIVLRVRHDDARAASEENPALRRRRGLARSRARRQRRALSPVLRQRRAQSAVRRPTSCDKIAVAGNTIVFIIFKHAYLW
jgi:hypothetical protein